MDQIETINLYGEKINGCIIREYTNSVLVQCEDGTRHLCRNERVGIKNKSRALVKQEAINLVDTIYKIQPSEDECEAILFARAFSNYEK